jgi:hypothetical protein
MELLGDVGQMEARLSLFGIVLISIQDWCTDCAKHAIGLQIILGTFDRTRR